MPPLRPLLRQLPQRSLLTARPASRIPLPITSTCASTKSFSTTLLRKSDEAHGSQYEPPTGWLFGVPPGEKYKKEGWEGIWYWGFWGSLGLAVVAYVYKPDSSIQTWALEEAQRRLEAEGILPEPTLASGPKVPK